MMGREERASLIDLERYPIDMLDTPRGRELVTRCAQSLRETGVCQLDGFLREAAITSLIAEAEQCSADAFTTDKTHNVYFTDVDECLPESDVRRLVQRSAKKAIAYDQIPAISPIRAIYEWDGLTRFIAAALGKTTFYRSADPLDACEIARFDPGDELGWHFDNSEFAVTMMLRPAESGGAFEYAPMIRTPDDERYDAVSDLLISSVGTVVQLVQLPGTLTLFRGRYSMHRVTVVGGSCPRLNAVLSYGEVPDMKLSPLTQKLFYGRVV